MSTSELFNQAIFSMRMEIEKDLTKIVSLSVILLKWLGILSLPSDDFCSSQESLSPLTQKIKEVIVKPIIKSLFSWTNFSTRSIENTTQYSVSICNLLS